MMMMRRKPWLIAVMATLLAIGGAVVLATQT